MEYNNNSSFVPVIIVILIIVFFGSFILYISDTDQTGQIQTEQMESEQIMAMNSDSLSDQPFVMAMLTVSGVALGFICIAFFGYKIKNYIQKQKTFTCNNCNSICKDCWEHNLEVNNTALISESEIPKSVIPKSTTVCDSTVKEKDTLQVQETKKKDKFEALADKTRKCLMKKFGVESVTYAKYDSAIKAAEMQYTMNNEKINSYRELASSVNKSKKYKIQPQINELKQQNRDIISTMEDLYICISIEEDNPDDKSIKNLREVTVQLKYYK